MHFGDHLSKSSGGLAGSGGFRAPVSPQLQGDYYHVVAMGNNLNASMNSRFLFACF